MAVHRDHRFINVWNAVKQCLNDTTELRRNGVTHGIWNIDGTGASIDGGFDHTAQIVDRRTARIFTGKLDVISKATCVFHCVDTHFQHIFKALLQFAFNVNG
jgi:hypothetical protein